MEVLTKKVQKNIRRFSTIVVVNILIIGICSAEIREESILSRPIIEGKSIAGVNIGDHESDIYKAIGFPDKLESNFSTDPGLEGKGLKLLIYGIGEGGLLLMYTRYQRVDAIWLFGHPGKSPYKGRTKKGVGLGDSSESVRRKYGPPDQEETWLYKKYGIAFGVDEKGTVGGILISKPNTDLSDYMRMRP